MVALRVFLSLPRGPGSAAVADAARAAIAGSGNSVVETAASDLPPEEQCRRMLRECDAYVGVLGSAYGPVLRGEPVSHAEFEYRTAGEIGVPRLVFLLSGDPEPGEDRQRAFRELVSATSPATVVGSARELADALPAALDAVAGRRGVAGRHRLLVLHCGGALGLAEAVAAELGVPARPVAHPDVQSSVDGTESALVLHHGGPLTPPESFGVGYALGHLGDRVLVLSTGPTTMLGSLGIPVRPWSGDPHDAARLARSALGHHVTGLPECFIAHAPEDAPFARRLGADLVDAGFALSPDLSELPPGTLIAQAIADAVSRADFVLAVLSRDALPDEWDQHDYAGTPLPLVPVLLDGDARRAWSEGPLSDRQAVDFTGWSDETEYRRALRRLVRALAIRTGADR
ncbi:TIR domain-containing protein [Actinosynnema sp. NPDC050436]|uniref:TIR domain-containing protein n=1 Tax=Actinosynnema sp. NPDC050436 TaxID=3155659 RepID=UPI0034047E8F